MNFYSLKISNFAVSRHLLSALSMALYVADTIMFGQGLVSLDVLFFLLVLFFLFIFMKRVLSVSFHTGKVLLKEYFFHFPHCIDSKRKIRKCVRTNINVTMKKVKVLW